MSRHFQTRGTMGVRARGCRSVEEDRRQRKPGFHADFHLLKWLHVCFPSETNKVFLLPHVLSLPLCLGPLPIQACQLITGICPLGSRTGAAPSLLVPDCCQSLPPGLPALPPPLCTAAEEPHYNPSQIPLLLRSEHHACHNVVTAHPHTPSPTSLTCFHCLSCKLRQPLL